MPTPSILVAKWDNGLFRVTGKMVHQELANQSVRGLVADGREECWQLLAGIRSADDPLMAAGLR